MYTYTNVNWVAGPNIALNSSHSHAPSVISISDGTYLMFRSYKQIEVFNLVDPLYLKLVSFAYRFYSQSTGFKAGRVFRRAVTYERAPIRCIFF